VIAWMVYTALVGVLVAATATAVDRLARLAQWATRWVWCTATIVALGLAGIAPYRTSSPAPALETTANVASSAAATVAPESWWSIVSRALSDARALVEAPFVVGAKTLHQWLPLSAGAFVIAAWLVLSVVLAILGVAVHARFRSGMRRWPLADVHGTRVRVSPTTGPVVIGLARPEIVLPRWVLDRPASEQMVILAHEAEHIKARDGLLLAGACGAVALMPWNPALWYMLSRVRLAVELDCDARVLRAGVAPKTYGTLLIDLAEQVLPLRVTATALADDLSHLHKRILAMKPHTPRFALLRGGAAAAIAVAGLLAACEAKMPTATDIQKMDVSIAEKSARDLGLAQFVDSTTRYIVDSVYVTAARARAIRPESIASVGVMKEGLDRATVSITTLRAEAARKISLVPGTTDNAVYTVDGVTTTAAAATAIPSDRIASVDVAKTPDGTSPATIRIRTKAPDGQPTRLAISGREGRVGGGSPEEAKATLNALTAPVFIIDGVRTDQAAFRRLRPEDIESVEVLKGKAAAATYGPDAEGGVITVKTKAQRE
jgi:TonB-dependent SusC/RagA subfamily outer membrane receptor